MPTTTYVITGDESAPPNMSPHKSSTISGHLEMPRHSPIVPHIAQIHNDLTGTHKLNLLPIPPNRGICNGEAAHVMNLHHHTCHTNHMLNHMYAPPYICTPPGDIWDGNKRASAVTWA